MKTRLDSVAAQRSAAAASEARMASGPLAERLSHSPRMTVQRQQTIKLQLAATSSQAPIQREVIRIGTDSGDGTLTYAPAGTVFLKNGQTFKGMVLVLIQIPKGERAKGYGGKLMNYFMTKVVGSQACYLDVKATDKEGLSNEKLELWYEKYGFTTLGYSDTGPVMGINIPKAKEESKASVNSGFKLVDYPDSDEDK